MKTSQVAHETGIFRCSNLMSTRSTKTGEEMEPCGCGNCVWLFFPAEQVDNTELGIVYINNLEVIYVKNPLEIGQAINLNGGLVSKCSGAFIVTNAYNHDGLVGVHTRIEVESAGPYDPTLPAFGIRTLGC